MMMKHRVQCLLVAFCLIASTPGSTAFAPPSFRTASHALVTPSRQFQRQQHYKSKLQSPATTTSVTSRVACIRHRVYKCQQFNWILPSRVLAREVSLQEVYTPLQVRTRGKGHRRTKLHPIAPQLSSPRTTLYDSALTRIKCLIVTLRTFSPLPRLVVPPTRHITSTSPPPPCSPLQ
jgi:hypothetical protein